MEQIGWFILCLLVAGGGAYIWWKYSEKPKRDAARRAELARIDAVRRAELALRKANYDDLVERSDLEAVERVYSMNSPEFKKVSLKREEQRDKTGNITRNDGR